MIADLKPYSEYKQSGLPWRPWSKVLQVAVRRSPWRCPVHSAN